MQPGAERRSGRSRFYHEVQLRGPIPQRVLIRLPLPYRPLPILTEAMMTLAEAPEALAASAPMARLFQRADWLPLLAAADATGLARLHRLMGVWLSRFGMYAPRAWAARLCAPRLLMQLRGLDLLLFNRDAPWREHVLDVIARQARHLARAERGGTGATATDLTPALARAAAALALPPDRSIGEPTSPALERALTPIASGEIPAGWRHLETALQAAHDITALEIGFAARKLTEPPTLAEAGKVARLFVSGFLTRRGEVMALPAQSVGDPGLVQAFAPAARSHLAAPLLEKVGFWRAGADGAAVIVDAGVDRGTLRGSGLTFYASDEAVIVPCGSPSLIAETILPGSRAWAAHLGTDNATSTRDPLPPATSWQARRHSAREGDLIALDAGRRSGMIRREVFLSADGRRLIVEDAGLEHTGGVLRFHLPVGAVALTGDGHDGGIQLASGRRVRINIDGGVGHAEESVGMGTDGRCQRTEQIVVTPTESRVRATFEL